MAKKTHDLYLRSHHSNFMDMGPEEGPAHEKAESASKERKEEKSMKPKTYGKNKTENKNYKGNKFPSQV